MNLKTLPPREDAIYTTEPFFKDGCDHRPENYVCSFRVYNHIKKSVERYDLYLFPEKFYGTEVCIRYGNEAHEYISPGSLTQFLINAGINWSQIPHYYQAAQILREHGRCFWEVRA